MNEKQVRVYKGEHTMYLKEKVMQIHCPAVFRDCAVQETERKEEKHAVNSGRDKRQLGYFGC